MEDATLPLSKEEEAAAVVEKLEGRIHCRLHNRIHRNDLVLEEEEEERESSSRRSKEVEEESCFDNCKDKGQEVDSVVLDCNSKIDRIVDNLGMTSSFEGSVGEERRERGSASEFEEERERHYFGRRDDLFSSLFLRLFPSKRPRQTVSYST